MKGAHIFAVGSVEFAMWLVLMLTDLVSASYSGAHFGISGVDCF